MRKIIMQKYYNKATEFEECVEKYLNEVTNIRTLNREEEKDLLVKISQGNEQALQKLLKHNLPFVIKLAKSYRGKGVSFSDLIGEGNLGLAAAVKHFDFTKDTKFICYAKWWIMDALNKAIEEQNKATGDCQDYQVIDINTPDLDEDESLINATYEDETINNSARYTTVQSLLDTLKDDEKEILMYFFGLNDHKVLNLKEISEKLNISNEKVRKLKDKALTQLKFTCMLKSKDEFKELQLIS